MHRHTPSTMASFALLFISFFLVSLSALPSSTLARASSNGTQTNATNVVFRDITVDNGVDLSVAFYGNATTATQNVVLLHGFPEGWYAWEEVAPLLVQDYPELLLVVPNMRGYNTSSKPSNVSDYEIGILVKDVVNLLSLTGQPVTLVGHDWGGVVAWTVAALHPELLTGLVILDAPHPNVFETLLDTSAQQRNDSAYILFLESPGAADTLSAQNYSSFYEGIGGGQVPWFGPDEFPNYEYAWSRPDELNSTLNYYKANFILEDPTSFDNFTTPFPTNMTISVNTTVLWGLQDTAFLYPDNIDMLKYYVDEYNVHLFENGTHFLAHQYPQNVSDIIGEFVRANGGY
eukprot:TRINITY_DN16695_c0_g1_i1.p1 TRINITY_DN16695_c0_g1~~TRINITY_DN16695_c0_g1_i1.p1  ORF type:complete len:346 (+),score=66.55 TRINITY_DN16695_c0_g1_i1:172-1209(+)